MAKQVYECNWVPSRVTEAQLDDLVLIGALGSKDTIHWRDPGKECPPTPQEGEVVVFVAHLAPGFNPPGSKFTEMFWTISNSIHKILAPILLQICVTSKCSVKRSFKRSPQWNCSETFSI